jgi:hypothetical protein
MIPASTIKTALTTGAVIARPTTTGRGAAAPSAIVTAGRGAVDTASQAQAATGGRGAAPETESRSAELIDTNSTDQEATAATAGRGGFFTKYKTPILIGGGLLGIFLIYQLMKKK